MLKNFILSENNIQRNTFVWNMIASLASSFQTMLFLLILSQNNDFVSASIITIGYAVANLAMTIGKYGIRNFQVSDVKEKYNFKTYLHLRYITVFALMLFSLGYVVKGYFFDQYTYTKSICVFLICVYKGIESFEDVYHGRLQQLNRLDIAMKILAIRNVLYIMEFIALYFITKNLLVTLCVCVVTTFVMTIFLNNIPSKDKYFKIEGNKSYSVRKLLIESLPVALSSFLVMYIANAPKYIIDSVVSDEEQTYFNIIFMVTFFVSMLCLFIFNPILKQMADVWGTKDKVKLNKMINNILFIIIVVVCIGSIFASTLGWRVLGWIYGVSLNKFILEINLMLVAGGQIAILSLLNLLYVIVREQKVLFAFCTICSFVLIFFGRYILVNYEMLGLIVAYLIVLGILDLVLLIVVKYKIVNHKEKKEESL